MKSLLATAIPLLAAWLLSSGAACAEEKVLALYCLSGEGCEGHLSDLTYAEADLLLDKLGTLETDGKGKPVVFLRNNGGEWVDYVDMKRGLAEINELFGGTGNPVIQLFWPELPEEHQPLDGDWQVSTAPPEVSGCPQGVAEQLAALSLLESGPVSFSKPFDPRSALPSPQVRWLKTKPNHYRAHYAPAGPDGPSALYKLVVDGPAAMTGALRVLVPGIGDCKIVMGFTYERG